MAINRAKRGKKRKKKKRKEYSENFYYHRAIFMHSEIRPSAEINIKIALDLGKQRIQPHWTQQQ